MKRFALLICACCSFTLCSYAQGRFSLEVHGGITTLLGSTLLNNWNTGWNTGVGVGYKLVSRVQLVVSGSYHRLPFRGDLRGFYYRIPDPSRITGNNSEIFETSIALRALSPGKYFQPFLSLQSGIYVMKVGRIFVFPNVITRVPPVPLQPLAGTGVTVARGFASIGLGLNVPVNENVAIRIESSYARTHDGGNAFIPIVSSVSFGL